MTERHLFRRVAKLSVRASLVLLLLQSLATCRVEDRSPSQQRILQDIKYLASDELEGRGVGTKGLDAAADYIRKQFQAAGLKSVLSDNGHFQAFDMPHGKKLGKPNEIVLHGPDGRSAVLAIEKDFMPLSMSASARFDAPLVFAGFGITAPEFTYDDFAEADVKGKILLVLRREPHAGDTDDPHAPFMGNLDTQHAALQRKLENAAKHGAAGLIVVSNSQSLKNQPDKLLALDYAASNPTAILPIMHVTRAVADSVLKPAIKQGLSELEAAINADLKPRTAVLTGWTCSGTVTVEKQYARVKNVLGVLDGAGPHADETIVVGAHYDHLGYGGDGSLAPGSREIHNGADDNASGTAGLMELARRLARRDPGAPRLGRRVIFAAFTAEESGLIGSRHYVEDPPLPISQTVAMINYDMIGRLRDDKLIVYGVGTATEFKPLLEKLNTDAKFSIRPIEAGYGPSDQTSFVRLKTPVLHFFTDNHPDYHKPTDDWEKVSVEGIDRVVSLTEAIIVALANAPEQPTYVDIPEPPPTSGGDRAYLGSVPAFGVEIDGVLLDGVTPGSPADKAGLRARDVIVKIGEHDTHSLEDMQAALVSYKPGQTVKVTVARAGLRITYPVTLGRRQ